LTLLQDIESFLACVDMAESEFEAGAKTPGLMRRLRNGSLPYARTETRARYFMDAQVSHHSLQDSGNSAAPTK